MIWKTVCAWLSAAAALEATIAAWSFAEEQRNTVHPSNAVAAVLIVTSIASACLSLIANQGRKSIISAIQVSACIVSAILTIQELQSEDLRLSIELGYLSAIVSSIAAVLSLYSLKRPTNQQATQNLLV